MSPSAQSSKARQGFSRDEIAELPGVSYVRTQYCHPDRSAAKQAQRRDLVFQRSHGYRARTYSFSPDTLPRSTVIDALGSVNVVPEFAATVVATGGLSGSA